MNKEQEKFFDGLKLAAEQLTVSHDNEAIRHDLLVSPILTNPFGLGWEKGETLAQVEHPLSRELKESYYWKGAVPVKRRPDLILLPYNISTVVGVVEEKKRQPSVSALESHVGQLLEYQYLHRCVWGLLTDGEKWVLTRNHEIFHRFEGLNDLKNHMGDLRACIGRQSIVDRIRQFGTSDLVFVSPSPNIVVVGYLNASGGITTIEEFLSIPSVPARDWILHLFHENRQGILQFMDQIESKDHRLILANIIGNPYADMTSCMIGYMDMVMEIGYSLTNEPLPRPVDHETKKISATRYKEVTERWNQAHTIIQALRKRIREKNKLSDTEFFDVCMQFINPSPLLGDCSDDFLRAALKYCETTMTRSGYIAALTESIVLQLASQRPRT